MGGFFHVPMEREHTWHADTGATGRAEDNVRVSKNNHRGLKGDSKEIGSRSPLNSN